MYLRCLIFEVFYIQIAFQIWYGACLHCTTLHLSRYLTTHSICHRTVIKFPILPPSYHTHTPSHVHIHTLHTYIPKHTDRCMHTHTRACACMHAYTRTHACTHTHAYTSTHTHMHTHTHTHTHTHMHTLRYILTYL